LVAKVRDGWLFRVGGVSPLVEGSPWINLGRRSASKRKYSLSEEKPKKSDIRQGVSIS